jgi:hypothetical protein
MYEQALKITILSKQKAKHFLVIKKKFSATSSTEFICRNFFFNYRIRSTLAGYPVPGLTGHPAVKSGVRPDIKKRPDYLAGRISGASLELSITAPWRHRLRLPTAQQPPELLF